MILRSIKPHPPDWIGPRITGSGAPGPLDRPWCVDRSRRRCHCMASCLSESGPASRRAGGRAGEQPACAGQGVPGRRGAWRGTPVVCVTVSDPRPPPSRSARGTGTPAVGFARAAEVTVEQTQKDDEGPTGRPIRCDRTNRPRGDDEEVASPPGRRPRSDSEHCYL